MTSRYGWGNNEPKILPGSQGGDRTNFFGIKIKALFTDLFAKLNIDANKLDGIQTGAEKNKNAFAKIKVGSSLILADNQEDTFEIVPGSNITITPDAANDKITIGLPAPLGVDITGSAASLSPGAKINGVNFNGTANITITAAANGGTSAACSGNAASATKLATGRTIQTDLGSTSAPSFDGTANITPGVKGILPVARGGTGASALSSITVGNATKATGDSAGQNINTTYIKGLSASGRTITYTKGNGSTGTIQTPAAPMTPTSSYWKSISVSNGRFTLPSGGTWAYAAIARQSTNTMTILDNVGVAAGGTTIQTSNQTFSIGDVLVWRIA